MRYHCFDGNVTVLKGLPTKNCCSNKWFCIKENVDSFKGISSVKKWFLHALSKGLIALSKRVYSEKKGFSYQEQSDSCQNRSHFKSGFMHRKSNGNLWKFTLNPRPPPPSKIKQKTSSIITVFLINMQVQGQYPHQWAPFQVAG